VFAAVDDFFAVGTSEGRPGFSIGNFKGGN